jgi:hypothetical protein
MRLTSLNQRLGAETDRGVHGNGILRIQLLIPFSRQKNRR